MIKTLDSLCGEFFGLGLDKVFVGFMGVVALCFSVETIKDIQTTKKLIVKKELEGSTKLSEKNNDGHELIIDDTYLPTNSSPYVKKNGAFKYL